MKYGNIKKSKIYIRVNMIKVWRLVDLKCILFEQLKCLMFIVGKKQLR